MREDPEIIKLLREEESRRLLTSISQHAYKELETPGEVFEDMLDKNIAIFEEKAEKIGIEDNLVVEIKKKRKSGIAVIGDVPWGTHLCQFYQTKDDLLDILVPYFKAGLENNEFCIWVTSESLNVEEAKTALGQVVKDLDDYIKKGQIEILDYRSWYIKSGKFDSDRVLRGWVEKEKKALKKGFDGLRLNGNTFWLGTKDWDDFKGYEEAVNDIIDKHRMIAICSYSLEKYNAPKIIDVVSNHQFTIIRQENKWNIIESPEYKRTKDELAESKENYQSFVEDSGAGIATTDVKGKLSYVNEAICKIIGYSKSELIGKPFIDFIHPDEKKKIMKLFSSAFLEPKRKPELEFRLIHKNGNIITCYASPTIVRSKGQIRGFNTIIQDITKYKQAEQMVNKAREYAESIVDTVREPLIVLDADLKVVSANPSFYQTFKTKPEETQGQLIYEIGNQQWDIPKLRELLEKILPNNSSFENYEVEHDFPHIGKRIMLLNARRIPQPPEKPRIILLAIEDITEHKKAQEEILNLSKFPSEDPNPVLQMAKDGKILYSNKSGLELLANWDVKIGEKAPKKWQRLVKKVLESAKPGSQEEEEVNDKIFSVIIVPTAEARYANIYANNITKRKKALEALQDSKAELKSIFDSSPNAITVTDLSGNIVECNQATLDTHGFSSKDELLGKKALILIAEKDYQIATKNILKTFEQGAIKNVEYTFFKKDKSEFIAELSASVIKDAHGKPVGFVAITKDITERKKNEEEIKKQNIQLKKLDRVKSNFLNVTSHELRTPMASIKGYVQMILKGKLGDLTEDERNALEVVLRNINRLDHLIQDILDISLLESKSMKFIPEKTNIKDVISEIIESMNCKALEKNIKIITEIDENLPDVTLDKERIRQVIINLIDNSIKFSPKETIINIRGKKQQKELLFEIQDQGRGIPKAHQEKIFGSFYQVDSGEDRKYGGAGLGLAISKSIIDIHGGKFWVESTGTPGKGSIFKFLLPINSEKYLKKIEETDISNIFKLERNK